MATLKIGSDWWTSPTESETGKLIMVTGRSDMDSVINSGKYNDRVEITWKYEGDNTGMPDYATSSCMEKVQEAIENVFDKDPVAILTGIYTGDGERNWILYAQSLKIFERKLNDTLASFDLLPITIYVEKDPQWNEYKEMRELSEIMKGE